MKINIYILVVFVLLCGCEKTNNKLTFEEEIQACELAESKGMLATASNACNRALENADKNQLSDNLKSQALYKLGKIKRQQSKYVESESLLIQSLAVEERIGNAGSYKVGLRLYELTLCLAGQNRWLDGAVYVQRLLPIINKNKQQSEIYNINMIKHYIKHLRDLNKTEWVDNFEKMLISLQNNAS